MSDNITEVTEITPEIEEEVCSGILVRSEIFKEVCTFQHRLNQKILSDGFLFSPTQAARLKYILDAFANDLNLQIQEMEMILDLHKSLKTVSKITRDYIPEDFKSGGGKPEEECT